MTLPPTSSANTATRNDAQAKETERKREPPAMVESQTILSQNVTDARPLCSYGYWSVQTPDQSCTYGYGRAWTLHHYAVYTS